MTDRQRVIAASRVDHLEGPGKDLMARLTAAGEQGRADGTAFVSKYGFFEAAVVSERMKNGAYKNGFGTAIAEARGR